MRAVSFWLLGLTCACAYGQWLVLVAKESGLCLWLRRLSCACGFGEWLVLVAILSTRTSCCCFRKLSSPRRLVVCDFNFSLTLQLTYEP